MKIILLEFVDEAEILLNKYGKNFFLAKDVITISLHPKVRIFLKKKGIYSKDTLDYLDNNAQHRIMLETENLTSKLIQKLQLEDSFGIQNGYQETCLHHLRMYINHFLWIIEILKGIRSKHQVKEIYCCLPKNERLMYVKQAHIHNQERFLGLLAQDFCKKNNINFVACFLKPQWRNFFVLPLIWLIRNFGILFVFLEFNFCILKKEKDNKMIVIPALSYNMGNLLKEIKAQNKNIRCVMVWEDKNTLKRELFKIYLILSNRFKKVIKKSVLDAVISLDLLKYMFKKDKVQQKKFNREFEIFNQFIYSEFKNSLVYYDIPFYSYLSKKITKGLKPEMLTLQHATMVLYSIFKKLKPNLSMSMYSRGIYYMMGELSRILDFNSLNISHGTHVPPNNEFEKIENFHLAKSVILNTYKYVAVQTPWTNKFLDYYGDKRSRLLSGPLLYSKNRQDIRDLKRNELLGENHNGKIIVHATTQKARTGLRFHITETLDEYISTLSDIIHAINNFTEVYFVLRPHPACALSSEELRFILPKCDRMFILKRESFSDILSIADLLISYSSTCIEEALQSEIPVILFDKWHRYNHFNIEETQNIKEISKKAVYYFSNPELFTMGLKKILDIFNDSQLNNDDLVEYRYPKESKSNFYDFVTFALNSKD